MFSILTTRTARTSIGVIAVVTLPLCLASCAGAQTRGVPVAELRASTNSDLLAAPNEKLYEVTKVQLLAPLDTDHLRQAVHDQVTPSGFMVVNDGVITQAELSVNVAGLSEASFVLTQPTILHRDGREGSAVFATGTLAVEGIEQHSTQVKLTPSMLDDSSAEFDVSFAVPASLLATSGEMGIGEVSAHISLAAGD